MASNVKLKIAFCFLVLSCLADPGLLLSKASESGPSSLPPNLDPIAVATSRNGTANGQVTSVLLTFTVRFMDGQPVPAAIAQLESDAGRLDAGAWQSNTTLNDGSCSFWIDPAQSYNLSLSAQGSKLSGGPIILRDPIAVEPSGSQSQARVRDLGDITIQFTSFCAGTTIIANSREGIAAGSGGIHVSALQVPNKTCTWILGPFGNSGHLVLSIQWLDLTSGDSLTIYGQKGDGKPQFTVLQIGPGSSSSAFTSYQRVEIPAPQATIVFKSGPGLDALSYGFLMYYQADRSTSTGQILTLSLVWVGGGLVILLAVLVLVWILRRRQRQLSRERASSFLSWDRLHANTSAEPDPDDCDVMVVKLPGLEPHRMALPQLVWNDKEEMKGSAVAGQDGSVERTPPLDTQDPQTFRTLKPLGPEGPEKGGSFLQLAEARPRRELAMHEEDAESCAICLEKYERGAMLRPLPCKHAFHTACIDTWLKKDPSCPLCKRALYCPPFGSKGCSDLGQRANENETHTVPASAQAPSSTEQTGPATDLEAGDESVTQSGHRPDEGSLNEAYERAEQDRRANRQRAPSPAWYLHQWLGWGW